MSGGLFITFEGGDGSGKSTQAETLAARLKRRRVPVTTVREPGGTQLGQLLRQVLKFSTAPRTHEAELLLFNASRSQLVSEVIRPALERGDVVLSDRFFDSTVAYQGYGRGLPLKDVEAVNGVGAGGVKPHLTLLLDFPPEERLKRDTWRSADRMEQKAVRDFTESISQGHLFTGSQEDKDTAGAGDWSRQRTLFEGGYEDKVAMDFHRRVRQGYLELARREPDRWLVVDARLPKEEIANLIWQRVETLLSAARGEAGRA